MVADLDIYRTAKVLIDEFEEMASVELRRGRTWCARCAPICAQGFLQMKEDPGRNR